MFSVVVGELACDLCNQKYTYMNFILNDAQKIFCVGERNS